MDTKTMLLNNLPSELLNYKNLIIKCADSTKGDYTLPCFALAKDMHKAPNIIANDLALALDKIEIVEKAEAVNGYLNIFLNKAYIAKQVCTEFLQHNTNMFKANYGNGKTICIDYSSANLAKYFHIGHLSTTILGECLARLFENAGYKVVRINFVGDYGTPFGKIVSAYKLWGSKQDIEARGVDAIQDLYVKFCKHDGEPEYDQMARDCFKKIEDKDPETLKIYNWIIDVSLAYNKKATAELGVHFDDFNGEAYYNDKMDDVVSELNKKGLLQDGENGSKIVRLGDDVAVIRRSDGASLYITRDLAAAIDRANKYQFYKNYYVTDVAQKLHFEEMFKILGLMGYNWAKDCGHIYYGRIRLPEGKISSRLGKQALIKDILDEAKNKAKEVIKDRHLPDADKVATVVAKGATAFIVTKNEKVRDTVFDLNDALRFDGETSPYMQYTYARCASILRKANANFADVDYKYLTSPEAFATIKMIGDFAETIKLATEKLEPNIVNKATMSLCTAVNKFYTTQRVITTNSTETNTKALLINIAKEAIKFGLNLICIDTVEEM